MDDLRALEILKDQKHRYVVTKQVCDTCIPDELIIWCNYLEEIINQKEKATKVVASEIIKILGKEFANKVDCQVLSEVIYKINERYNL